ncbi:hypothetical protein QL995_07655 [Pseudoalteromonas sp. APC 3358]|uniref:hypothetical protein n=1 Tax=Pseudoalteromonas sp. APC 3358 TaxID=3035176 RepID=UPI0025B48E03|nr:hypothetical protein [Pseudoalteromonas sp. APC 3358]MDN3382544.1 hypothetical protein [Pseudoalteromonas sp. APC 3358]
MFDLQKALNERLATLKNKKVNSKQSINITFESNESIQKSLTQAGILNKNGKLIKRIAA